MRLELVASSPPDRRATAQALVQQVQGKAACDAGLSSPEHYTSVVLDPMGDKMQASRWEYKTVKIPAKGWFLGGRLDEVKLDRLLNDLGAEGWELVSILATTQVYGASRDIAAVFKRPTEAEPRGTGDRPRDHDGASYNVKPT